MKRLSFVAIFTGVIVGVLTALWIQPVLTDNSVAFQLRKYGQVFSTAVRNYVEEVDPVKLTEAAIRGMLGELDVHSVYIPPKEKKKVDEDFRGSFEGIGIQFDIINDTITVVTPIVGGPSEKVGIMAGDKIVKIDGENAVGLTIEEVPKKLKGPKGTKVTVHIKRAGVPELLEFTIVRDRIPLYSVDAAFLIDGTDIGYIRINRFAATTLREFLDAVRRLRQQGMQKLLLDLRWNPGGYLQQAFAIADQFIPAGYKIVYTRGRRPEFNQDFYATEEGEVEDIPVIVLINAGSASASEIVSGAIQDIDRGLIVGETSFGKGLVQQQYELPDGSAFRITTSKYYTPSGRLIQRPYYKDKKKYYQLKGRPELKEGENITHTGESDTTRPRYKTLRLGRTVYGGGGIVPDYVVKSDTITPFYRKLRNRRIVRLFVDAYMQAEGQHLRQQYQGNFSDFYHHFQVTDRMWELLRERAAKADIQWDEEQFERDKRFIAAEIKAMIARMIWHTNESVAVQITVDRQVQKALTLFDEAAEIAGLH